MFFSPNLDKLLLGAPFCPFYCHFDQSKELHGRRKIKINLHSKTPK